MTSNFNKEHLDMANEYLCEYGCISIPFLQKNLKISYSLAESIYKYIENNKKDILKNLVP